MTTCSQLANSSWQLATNCNSSYCLKFRIFYVYDQKAQSVWDLHADSTVSLGLTWHRPPTQSNWCHCCLGTVTLKCFTGSSSAMKMSRQENVCYPIATSFLCFIITNDQGLTEMRSEWLQPLCKHNFMNSNVRDTSENDAEHKRCSACPKDQQRSIWHLTIDIWHTLIDRIVLARTNSR